MSSLSRAALSGTLFPVITQAHASSLSRHYRDQEPQLISRHSLLRNLCIDGGYDLCAEIYNKGILSPLAALIPQVRSK